MLRAVTLLGITSGNERLQEGIATLLPSYQKLLTSMGCLVCVNGRSGIIVGVTSTGELRVQLGSEPGANSVAAPEICLKPGAISLGYS